MSFPFIFMTWFFFLHVWRQLITSMLRSQHNKPTKPTPEVSKFGMEWQDIFFWYSIISRKFGWCHKASKFGTQPYTFWLGLTWFRGYDLHVNYKGSSLEGASFTDDLLVLLLVKGAFSISYSKAFSTKQQYQEMLSFHQQKLNTSPKTNCVLIMFSHCVHLVFPSAESQDWCQTCWHIKTLKADLHCFITTFRLMQKLVHWRADLNVTNRI